MGNFNTRITLGAYQYCDGNNISFAGSEVRYGNNNGYVGVGGYVASENLKNPYGLFDLKGKLNYDKKGIVEQNIRIRTAFDDDIKSTQIRYSPVTVNIPVGKDVSIYSNTHYSGKYNFDSGKWKHSAGNFTGVSWDISKKDNLALEAQRYNIQDFKNNKPENWSVNLMFTHKF